MKRYLLFAGNRYYPCGGWEDFRGAFDSVEQAQEAALVPNDDFYTDEICDWYHIVDGVTGTRVFARARVCGSDSRDAKEWFDPSEGVADEATNP